MKRRTKTTTPPSLSRKDSASAAKPDPLVDVLTRLETLERQVAALSKTHASMETAVPSAAHSTEAVSLPQKFWVINGILRNALESGNEAGGVTFGGQVVMPTEETFAWQIESDAASLMGADWAVAHAPLAALAHPVRLALLKALLEGKRDTQSLASLPNMGTTGQLYHHLKELEAAGWIRQPRRGEYIVLAERVVPLLAILAACEVTQR